MSIAAFLTAACAYIPEYWPDEIDRRIGWIYISATVGIVAGPLIGSMLFQLGYIWIYIIPSLLIIFIGNIICSFVFPSKNLAVAAKATVIYVIGQMGYVVGCVILLFFKVENRRGMFYISVFLNILG